MRVWPFLWETFTIGSGALEGLLAWCKHPIFDFRPGQICVFVRELRLVLGVTIERDIPVLILYPRDNFWTKCGLMAWVTSLIGGIDTTIGLIGLGF